MTAEQADGLGRELAEAAALAPKLEQVCAAFHILAAHQRRHLRQAGRAALAVRAAAAGGAV